jgi:hypothetical protein
VIVHETGSILMLLVPLGMLSLTHSFYNPFVLASHYRLIWFALI